MARSTDPEREGTAVWHRVRTWWVRAGFEPSKHDEDWPVYALGEAALIFLFCLLLIVAVRLLLDALGIASL